MSCFVMRCHEASCAPGLRRPLLLRLPRARRVSSVRFQHASRAPSLSGIEKAAPLCPEGAETPRGCHEMSCSVMPCSAAAAPVSADLPEAPSVCIPHVIPPSRFVPFVPPPACLRRVPFSRVSHGRARAFAPARFARLIARASKRRAQVSRPFRWVFSRRREAGDGAARGCRFLLSHPTTVLQGSSLYRELFHNS